jgi:hypothetical protein
LVSVGFDLYQSFFLGVISFDGWAIALLTRGVGRIGKFIL